MKMRYVKTLKNVFHITRIHLLSLCYKLTSVVSAVSVSVMNAMVVSCLLVGLVLCGQAASVFGFDQKAQDQSQSECHRGPGSLHEECQKIAECQRN